MVRAQGVPSGYEVLSWLPQLNRTSLFWQRDNISNGFIIEAVDVGVDNSKQQLRVVVMETP